MVRIEFRLNQRTFTGFRAGKKLNNYYAKIQCEIINLFQYVRLSLSGALKLTPGLISPGKLLFEK